jgi:hypothetical protein
MGGDFHAGDSLGLWTFNQTLYTGKFPLQELSPRTQGMVFTNVLAFLSVQKFEKDAALDKVMPSLDRVIKGSDFITIVLVSSGDTQIAGTPFDDAINKYFKTWHDQQQKARQPFVTVLRAAHGKATTYTLNSAPWPVEMPEFPAELKAAVIAHAKPPQKHQSTVPPLIVIGKHHDPETNPPPAPAAATLTNPLPPQVHAEPSSEPATIPSPAPSSNVALITSASTPAATSALPDKAPSSAQVAEPSVASPGASTHANPDTESSTSSGPETPKPGQTAVTVPGEGAGGRGLVWFVALGAGLVGLVLLSLFRGRARPTSNGSLITRSIERETK